VRFTKLEINHWQQFERIDISIHERLTILTGANGSGKTTLLNILAKHFGWEKNSLATPRLNKSTGGYSFPPRLYSGLTQISNNIIGAVWYSNQATADILIPSGGSTEYQLVFQNPSQLKGFFIPSHRSVFRYQRTENISTVRKNRVQAFDEFSNINKQRYMGHSNQSSSFLMKNILISWVIKGYGVTNSDGKDIMPPDEEQRLNFEGFQFVLKKVLPKTLGFENLEIRDMEIVFVCNDGSDEFLLETTSGGISALIDIAWQIFMFSTQENSDFTVIIDEIENHLHPTMQRTILQNLINAFPNARFIVSTHSPLVVGSVKDSAVYALRYNENNKVVSEYLDLVDKAKTASEILDEVLGVSFTMPVWVEDKLNEIINAYSKKELTNDYFANLREELGNAGLGSLMPYAIQSVVETRG
jgi:hypothetical protein